MSRLTIRTDNGAALKLDNPQNEAEARKQLHDKYLIAIDKLAHYETLEEQGRLIELPCKVGTPVYVIENTFGNDCTTAYIAEYELTEISYDGRLWTGEFYQFGKEAFATKEEAEAKLAELKGAEE